MFQPLKIVFELDGTGVYYDPAEPPMLDGLLAAACAVHHVSGEPPSRDEEPDEIPLPLRRWKEGGTWGWMASALFPSGKTHESLTFWRKRLRQGRIERTDGSPNWKMGTYRDWQMPLPILLVRELVAFANGERRKVLRELRRSIRFIGKKRALGRGRVTSINVIPWDDDWSIERDGRLTRWYPTPGGSRLVRPRPPYWSSRGRVLCGEIGEEVEREAK